MDAMVRVCERGNYGWRQTKRPWSNNVILSLGLPMIAFVGFRLLCVAVDVGLESQRGSR